MTSIVSAYKADSYRLFLLTIWHLDALKSRVERSIKSTLEQKKHELGLSYRVQIVFYLSDRRLKRIATIIERLLLINPFFNDPTDRINHTETRPYMYMHQ